ALQRLTAMAGSPRRRPARSSSAKGPARRPRATRPAGRQQPPVRKRAVTGSRSAGAPLMNPRRWVALCSLSLLLAVMLLPTLKSWYDQQQRLDELHAQVSEQQESVAQLRREKHLWSTDEYVEAQARKRLKFVRPGERSYTVADTDAADAPEVDPETGAVKGQDSQPWYDQVASSVKDADDPGTHVPSDPPAAQP